MEFDIDIQVYWNVDYEGNLALQQSQIQNYSYDVNCSHPEAISETLDEIEQKGVQELEQELLDKHDEELNKDISAESGDSNIASYPFDFKAPVAPSGLGITK